MTRNSVVAHVFFTAKAIAWGWGVLVAAGYLGMFSLPLIAAVLWASPDDPGAAAVAAGSAFLVGAIVVMIYSTRPTMAGFFSTRAILGFLLLRLTLPLLWAAAGWILLCHNWRPHLDPEHAKYYWIMSLPLSYLLVGFFTRYLPWSRAVHEAFEVPPPAVPAAEPID